MLPGIRPSHTRPSFCSRSRLYVEKSYYCPTVEEFIKLDDTGLWLLPAVVAEKDRRAGEEQLLAAAEVQKAAEMKKFADISTKAARILGRTAITDTGCMVGGLRYNQDLNKWAHKLADLEHGGILLTEEADMPHIRTCGNEDCYNSRHFEIDYGKPTTLSSREYELNPNWFYTAEDDSIMTVWGDKLPSLKESMEYFMWFQRQNYPLVPYEKSLLTATPIAQIRFHPVSGCWESWKYYSKKESENTRNGRFAGYGQMYNKYEIKKVDEETGEVLHAVRRGGVIAHILIWKKTGHYYDDTKVLNHLCNYKRCCNPLHLKQETMGQNTSHGNTVNTAMKLMIADNPEIENQFLSAAEMVPHHRAAQEMYREIEKEIKP